MQVNPVIQQHRDVSVICLIAKDCFDPVVFRKNRGDNAQLVSCSIRIIIVLLCAAGKHADCHHKRKQQRNYFFHRLCYLQNDHKTEK